MMIFSNVTNKVNHSYGQYEFSSCQNHEIGAGWIGDKLSVSATVQPGIPPIEKCDQNSKYI